MGVLELVGLDILPQCLDDHWTGLSVNPQETSQAGIQFELGRLKQEAQKGEMATDTANRTCPALLPPTSYLVIQHQKDSTAHIYISWPLHLEAICLLSCSSPVPLEQERAFRSTPTLGSLCSCCLAPNKLASKSHPPRERSPYSHLELETRVNTFVQTLSKSEKKLR